VVAWVEYGGYLGTDDATRGEAAFWTPLLQNPNSLMFLEMRGKLFEESAEEGNFALGYRKMLPSGWNLGVWGGYDLRGTAFGSTFDQLSGGVELLSPRFDIRANGYLPLGDEETLFSATSAVGTGTPTVQLSGNDILLVTPGIVTTTIATEYALSGFDGEVGMRLFGSQRPRGPELRVYGGGFWFEHEDVAQEIAGPRARLELRFDDIIDFVPGSRLTIEGEFSHDEVRDDKWEIGARLRIPFGGASKRYASLTAQERRMTDALERDTDIVAQQQASSTSAFSATAIEENVIDDETDVALDQVAFVDGSNAGDLNAAGANTLIIADGGNGTIDGNHQLGGDQTLVGGGATIRLRGASTGAVANFTAPGARPTLSGAGGGNNLTLDGNNIHVAGVDIAGSGIAGSGIFATNRSSNIRIADTEIAGTGSHGIAFASNHSGVTITGSSVTNAGIMGIYFDQSNSNITIADTTVRDVLTNGINFSSNNSAVTIVDTVVTDAGGSGISFITDNSDVTISNSIIGDADNGIEFYVDNTISLNSSRLDGAFGQYAIYIGGSGNILDGIGNSAGTILGFCFDIGAQTGSFSFTDDGSGAPGSCP